MSFKNLLKKESGEIIYESERSKQSSKKPKLSGSGGSDEKESLRPSEYYPLENIRENIKEFTNSS